MANKLTNKFGKRVNPLDKKAFGQYNSIYEFPNAGRYRQRMYVNQDTEIGAGFLTRDLLVRWSREMAAQMPFIHAGIRSLALFSVGKAYDPIYLGKNKAWWESVKPYILEVIYPNICMRGRNYDFKTMMFLKSVALDTDGDMLEIFGEKNGLPKVQIIPSHRIFSTISRNGQDVVTPNLLTGAGSVTRGPWANTISSDGVIYDKQGEAVGYSVINSSNVVNSMMGNNDYQIFTANEAHLHYDPVYFDRGRGFPSISAGILQALSLQEIQQYMLEKIKIESMVALIEKTPEGVGPYEEGQAYQDYLNQDGASLNGFQGGVNVKTANTGLRVVNDPAIRYISVDGDIKSLNSTTPADQTTKYISNLEAQVLQCIGIPHALLFSHDTVSGRISDGVVKLFNAAIEHRQEVLDKSAKFILGWAVAKAIKNGDLPPNDDENLGEIFDFTHPPILSLNSSYDRGDKLKAYAAGTATLEQTIDIPVEDFLAKKKAEDILWFNTANEISATTNTPINIVYQRLSETMLQKTPPPLATQPTP